MQIIEDRIERKCWRCKKPITACMGFVNAGDFIEAAMGKRSFRQVKELCGKCVEYENLLIINQ